MVKSVSDLRASCRASNAALLRELREDSHSTDLLRITSEDAELGRMTAVAPIEQFDLDSYLLHPRFAVTKLKADGSHKVGLRYLPLPPPVWLFVARSERSMTSRGPPRGAKGTARMASLRQLRGSGTIPTNSWAT